MHEKPDIKTNCIFVFSFYFLTITNKKRASKFLLLLFLLIRKALQLNEFSVSFIYLSNKVKHRKENASSSSSD